MFLFGKYHSDERLCVDSSGRGLEKLENLKEINFDDSHVRYLAPVVRVRVSDLNNHPTSFQFTTCGKAFERTGIYQTLSRYSAKCVNSPKFHTYFRNNLTAENIKLLKLKQK